jgi:hypothetical protein
MSGISTFTDLTKKMLRLELEHLRLAGSAEGGKSSGVESRVIELMGKYLPGRYSFGRGFVAQEPDLSPEAAIVVYDGVLNTPIYQGETANVYAAGSVYGVVEIVTSKLDRKKLDEAVKKLGKIKLTAPPRKIEFMRPVLRDGAVEHESLRALFAPRTYMMALAGTDYGSVAKLARDLEKLCDKYKADVHGLLVLGSTASGPASNGWYLRKVIIPKVKPNNGGSGAGNTEDDNPATEYAAQDVLLKFIEQMKVDFLDMLVGRYPAA